MITDTCTALRQAEPLDSLFEMLCNADTSAVADIEAAASIPISDFTWPLMLKCVVMVMIVSIFCFLIYCISQRNPSPIVLEVARIRNELIDIQNIIDRKVSSLEETVRETGRRAKTSPGPRRSSSKAKKRKTAKEESHSGESLTNMSGETKIHGHE